MEVSKPLGSRTLKEDLPEERGDCPDHGPYTVKVMRLFGTKIVKTEGCAECARIQSEAEERARRITASAAMQAKFEDELGRAGIPTRLRNRSFDSYATDLPGQRNALALCRDFAEQFERHKREGTTLVLSGKTGTGKGHLAASIAIAIMREGQTAYYATAREIILMLRESWNDRSAPSELEVLRRLVDIDLLVIDEIGVQSGTDAERDQLFSVIDGRYREQRPMILTTNLTRNELPGVIGERAFSRLREDGLWISFDWADWRARRVA